MKRKRRLTWRQRYRLYLKSANWAAKRRAALKRYGRRCSRCGSTRRINVHHLRYGPDWKKIPIKDLRVLCRVCHRLVHKL